MKNIKTLLHYYLISYSRDKRKWVYEYLLAGLIAIFLMIGSLVNPPALYFLAIYAFLIPFTYFSIGYSLLGEIMTQKSSGFKLYMKSCGITGFEYQIYSFALAFTKTFIYCLIILTGVAIGALIKSKQDPFDYGDLLLIYVLSAFATTTFILFLSSFCSHYKFATDSYVCIYLGLVVFSLLLIQQASTTTFVNFLSTLFPPSNFIIGAYLATGSILTNSAGIALTDFTFSNVVVVLPIETVVYLFLYFYFDRVLDDGTGYVSHPCFLFNSKNGKRVNIEPLQESLLSNPPRDLRVESTDSFTSRKKEKKILEVFRAAHKTACPERIEEMTFEIEKGDSLCLLGNNKITLTNILYMLSGIKSATQGEIRYEDRVIYPKGDSVTSDVGLCCSPSALNLKFRVKEQISMLGQIRTQSELTVEEILEELKISALGDTMIENLSYFQKIKVCLAMIYHQGVKTVFINSITENLNPEDKEEILNDICNMRDKGYTIVYVANDLKEAFQVGTLISLFHQGRLEKFGRGAFLSKEYNVGCHLRVLLKNEGINDKNKLELLIHAETLIKQIDGVIAEEDDRALCKFFIPLHSKLFKTLRDLKKKDEFIIETKIDDVQLIFKEIEAKKSGNFIDKV